jgi:hypothetical protein
LYFRRELGTYQGVTLARLKAALLQVRLPEASPAPCKSSGARVSGAESSPQKSLRLWREAETRNSHSKPPPGTTSFTPKPWPPSRSPQLRSLLSLRLLKNVNILLPLHSRLNFTATFPDNKLLTNPLEQTPP